MITQWNVIEKSNPIPKKDNSTAAFKTRWIFPNFSCFLGDTMLALENSETLLESLNVVMTTWSLF